jgi:hypothetical protein
VDYGDGDDFKITSGTGCYGAEGVWGNEKAALHKSMASLPADQYVKATFYSQGEDGSHFGVAARANATGTDFYSLVYSDDDEFLRMYSTVSGTSTQITFTDKSSDPLTDGDQIMIVCSNDTVYAFYKGTLTQTEYDTDHSSGAYAGLSAMGGSNQIIKTWEAGEWP